jgi:hypothetical protein
MSNQSSPKPGVPLALEDHDASEIGLASDAGYLDSVLTESDAKVTLNGRLPTTRPLVTEAMAAAIQKHVPPLQRLSPAWHLVYSLDQHGTSIHTLYNRTSTCISTKSILPRGHILVVQDSKKKIFGAYLSDPLKMNSSFYGNGETFVFEWDPESESCQVYPWTGMNDYFIFGETHYFAIGASEGKFAIYMDEVLNKGKSAAVATFNNPVLSSDTSFETWELELWGFST